MAISKKKSPPKRGKRGAGDRNGGEGAAAVARVPDEERYALALESIQHGVYDWDIDQGTIYYSPTLRAIFGLQPGQDLTPAESVARVHPDDLPAYREALIAHLRGETAQFVTEYRYLGNEDTWRWSRQSGIALRRPDGTAYRMVGATSDITESRQRELDLSAARAEIETTRETMRTILDNMHDGILLIDKNLRWRFDNAQFNRFVELPGEIGKAGASCDEVIRYQVLRGDFGPVDDVETMVAERVAVMRKPGGNRYLRKTANGRWIDFPRT